jgi:hypothetical protein
LRLCVEQSQKMNRIRPAILSMGRRVPKLPPGR